MKKIPTEQPDSLFSQLRLFFQRETVLSIAIILAFCSMFIVVPDHQYISYIDFRTLGILFCLMTIVAALKNIGLFDQLAATMLSRVHTIKGIVTLLVLLCFFLSMVITNDVALITFVPLTIIVMKHLPQECQKPWILKTVVMQTIAANLGSMLTPIGNPQNLYLYGKADINILNFIQIIFPYSAAALILLLLWIGISARKNPAIDSRIEIAAPSDTVFSQNQSVNLSRRKEYLIAYFIFFAISLLSVGHILSFIVPFVLVLTYSLLRNRKVLKQVDYSLLGTFIALFIFIGNLGRITWFCTFLQGIITGHEAITAVISSQIMSNVPAAILLAGFTDQFQALIIGTNIGGLGTLIASMASLISFKYIAKENVTWRGRYFIKFTLSNIVFLVLLLILMFCIS